VSDVEVYDRTDIPLTLQVTPGDPWQIELLYDGQRFDRATISRMGGHFVQLLEEFEAHPERTLGQYRMVTAAETQELLEVFNNTKAEFDAEPHVPGAIRGGRRRSSGTRGAPLRGPSGLLRRVERTRQPPGALLPGFGGTGPGRPCRHGDGPLRTDGAVCILAIWKCGAAYVPIEPRYPEERIRTIVDEARPKLVLSAGRLGPHAEAESSGYEASDPGIPARPGDLAYVIFTSGSTGKPKGVMIEHAGMLNHLLSKVEEFEIASNSVIAQTASHCFDISVWQFFAALLAGGTTVIYGDAVVLDPGLLHNRIESDRVTILEVVPSYLAALLPRLEPIDAGTDALSSPGVPGSDRRAREAAVDRGLVPPCSRRFRWSMPTGRRRLRTISRTARCAVCRRRRAFLWASRYGTRTSISSTSGATLCPIRHQGRNMRLRRQASEGAI
jgi:non-ribosomal peptide synthetase component F